jgi:chondroitin AC lyase
MQPKLIPTIILMIFSLPFSGGAGAFAQTDLQRVGQNLRASLLTSKRLNPGLDKAAEAALKSMKADGSWADQDYSDQDRVHWKAVNHLPRLVSIARDYYSAGSGLSGQRDVLNRILTSLKFWLDKDPHNENWWHNEIGVPEQVGTLLVLLGPDAPNDLRQRGMELMKRAKWERQTGANLTDETKIQVMRGCVAGSAELVAQAFDRTWQEVKLAGPGEDGMQVDHSFHQHGPLLYCRGYGTVFADDIVEFVQYAAGTRFQIPADRQKLFDEYLLDGPQWMVRGGNWDFGACGRGIVRPGTVHGSNLGALAIIAQSDGPDQKELQSALDQSKQSADKSFPIGNRHYWLSDYMVQRRPGFLFSMRMYSDRTLNTDGLTNGENRKSHHIADGATCIMVNGDEYFDIFPVWDWMRIPGTTVEQNVPLVPKEVSHKGKSGFVGGVSDGSDGCSAMELIHGDLHAKKAWFCFDDTMVCLGTQIDCAAGNPVFTSLNQCHLHGPVGVFGENDPVPAGDRDLKDAKWVWHDSVGYVFPQPTNVHLKTGPQSGAWDEIGSGSNKPVSADVFGLWIDHGTSVHGAHYEYIVLPGADSARTAAESQSPTVQVISNTGDLQAVRQRKSRQLEAVFYKSGEVKADDVRVSVDQPCLLLMKRQGPKMEIAVCNPLNAPGRVAVSVALNGSGNGRLEILLPEGLPAGSSVVKELTVGN